MLIAVPSTWSDEQPYRPIGRFELLPSAGANDESTQEALISQRNCPGGVTDVNPEKSKNSISVDWIAPRHPQGCVSFKYVFTSFYTFEKDHLMKLERRWYVPIRSGSKTTMR